MPVRSMEKGDKGIFVMKRSLAALVLLMILACALSCAHAQEVPQAILDWMAERGYENESWDSLLFDLPDESAFAFLLNDWSLYGFLQKDGAWQNHSSGSIMQGHAGLRFERHRQGQARADGSAWPDDLGFDIVSEDGSRLSYRYDGQWFSICGWYDPQRYPGEVLVQGTEQFVLHYNFPPFSTGEAKAARGLSRREIGHGHLAWRALKPMIPLGEDNPYAVRVVSDILESNGSSSMATVCAGTLALMDAGVKLRKPVSGIAMGLISDSETGKWAVLSDILGDEDHLGDMDFKVTGTKDGITATQMDIKVDGLSYEVLAAALEQARKGRMHILGKLTECIAEPREDYKPCVPRIVQIVIPQDMIGPVIGPGGKVIQDIQKTTNTTITITEVDNKGIVDIFGIDKEALDGALARIKAIVAIPEVGETYHGKVRSIVAFGAFVEIMPGKDALLHISEIDYKRFETMEETGLKEGDEIDVKLIGVDPKTNKLKLSRKALLPKPEGYVERERRPRPERGERGERRDRGERRERHEHKEE